MLIFVQSFSNAATLTPFRMVFWGLLKAPLPKISHTNPTKMKLGTVIPYLKKIQKYMNHVTHPLSSADVSTFSPEISIFRYIKKYRLHFDS